LIKSNVQGLFATPIYFSVLERNLTEKENNFINQNKKEILPNDIGGDNETSKDNYILEKKELTNLKKDLLLRVKDYFNKIEDPVQKIKPYITQSWLNINKKGTYHHEHNHANSYLSGVFYVNSQPDKDSITFKDSNYYQINLGNRNNYNAFNSREWTFSVKTGAIIIFPSYLKHTVSINKHDNHERISLAFNVFIKGTIGEKKGLTELVLK